ncbi:metallophosphoesterase family protein [Devosia sp. PTR5]|uniref:Metallophosphoesterase family protein n=1 Tax=Devosia oryzisoli TaxID=2774138 RepID=A0A927FVQ6_9HYPH|nr:metallophosphoesterase family protein [Devosia oryzisoli]MBD8065529.1 metallophosphoesterase family protein [Devosia oryzisoli]
MLYFTSDTHFSDPRVLRIDRRPFPTLEAHDAALIGWWNEIVGPDDVVWHLGDFAKGSTEDVERLLGQLQGTKHLIIGNNDPETTLAARGWASTQHYAEMRIDGQLFILCHYPFRTWNQMGKKSIDLHGHSHGRLKPVTRQYDVGVDAQDFRPRRLEEILARHRRTN